MSSSILATLGNDRTSWPRLVSFSPSSAADASTDENQRNRYLALLALHAAHHPTLNDAQHLELILYLLEQEIRYHHKADHYRSSISLACYLLARFKRPEYLWVIWAARESNYDTSICVDSHFLYYAAGGTDHARTYVESCTLNEVLPFTTSWAVWWNWLVEETDGDKEKAFAQLKLDVLKRIEHDRKHGVTDEKVVQFMEASWRQDTQQWGESLLPEAY